MATAFLDAPGPLAFAHRGGAAHAPENSWRAFEHAVGLGYRYLETDLQATADGVLVAFHDKTLTRVCGQEGQVRRLTRAELSAARIDGTSRLGILFKIVLPLSLPALATLGIIQFMWSWNDFLWPLIIIDTPSHAPLQLGLSTLQGAHFTEWNLLMAGTLLSQIPMLAIFLLAQRWFIRSIAFTGIK